jgi:hypothetical protein
MGICVHLAVTVRVPTFVPNFKYANVGTGHAATSAVTTALLTRRVLHFLQVTQDADGHWCQNMWLDG